MHEKYALLKLSALPGFNNQKLVQLLECFGTAEAVWTASSSELRAFSWFNEKLKSTWDAREAIAKDKEKELEKLVESSLRVISCKDPLYPKQLLGIANYPPVLNIDGDCTLLQKPCIAVVGTRFCTNYGLEMAEKISAELAAQGFTIISGLAAGIDTAAHKGALTRGKTVAVLGSGLGVIYPKENSQLAEEIRNSGALVSEFPHTTPPERHNFPRRNRIVSGLSLAALLIEAPCKSGAMITVNLALEQGKQIFALPGRADLENFRGNHQLIKKKAAILIENSRDIAEHFDNLFTFKGNYNTLPERKVFLEPEELQVMKTMSGEEKTYDQLAALTLLPATKLNVILMNLLLKKAIKELPGKLYKKII